MGESLMQQRRVSDEGLRIVKLCPQGRILTVLEEEAPANYVPAALLFSNNCPPLIYKRFKCSLY